MHNVNYSPFRGQCGESPHDLPFSFNFPRQIIYSPCGDLDRPGLGQQVGTYIALGPDQGDKPERVEYRPIHLRVSHKRRIYCITTRGKGIRPVTVAMQDQWSSMGGIPWCVKRASWADQEYLHRAWRPKIHKVAWVASVVCLWLFRTLVPKVISHCEKWTRRCTRTWCVRPA